MVTLRASVRDQEPELVLPSLESLDAALDAASVEAKAQGRLNIVILSAPNRDWLGLTLGGEETVVSFNYGHGNPPYFASRGDSQADEPVLTAFVGLVHHTELSRRWVVPLTLGRQAAREFHATGERPSSLEWLEL
jgi:hypothetical protein